MYKSVKFMFSWLRDILNTGIGIYKYRTDSEGVSF